MLVQSVLDRGDSVSPSTAEIGGRVSGLGLRCGEAETFKMRGRLRGG